MENLLLEEILKSAALQFITKNGNIVSFWYVKFFYRVPLPESGKQQKSEYKNKNQKSFKKKYHRRPCLSEISLASTALFRVEVLVSFPSPELWPNFWNSPSEGPSSLQIIQ